MSFKEVSLSSVPALRTECDDHIATALDTLEYNESFKLIDTKLIIGYTCVILSGLMYYIEKQYKDDFLNSDYVKYTTILVALFFILEGIWYLFSIFFEKDIKYVGIKNKKTLKVSTFTKSKTDPYYHMIFEIDGNSEELVVPFSELFFDDGFLSMDAFTKKISSLLESKDKSK